MNQSFEASSRKIELKHHMPLARFSRSSMARAITKAVTYPPYIGPLFWVNVTFVGIVNSFDGKVQKRTCLSARRLQRVSSS
jgi:hypothetical protein